MVDDYNELIEQRIAKIKELREMGINPFANDFKPEHTTADIIGKYGSESGEKLEALDAEFSLAGRVMAVRNFGKAAFAHIQDGSGKLQIFFQKNMLGDDFGLFKKHIDIGDFIGVRGALFRTKTDELTLAVKSFKLLTKSLRPLPEKFHGLKDVEIRYRQRYLDLVMNEEVRRIFTTRCRIIDIVRRFLIERSFMEVETPMMQSIPGGATARPFVTHHRALDMDLFLRIAPELYLKRLLVGGFERVFEINRNFRNEGVSTRHNPEFTMLEFYQAYATFEDLMQITEDLFTMLAKEILGGFELNYGDLKLDLTPPWPRKSVHEALLEIGGVPGEVLSSRDAARDYAKKLGLEPHDEAPLGRIIMDIFDETVEPKLSGPIFITQFPLAVSPLSRKNEKDPEVVDRFEIYIAGQEIGNAFSELNDPIDQKERFLQQVKEKEAGDEEAHAMDADYIRALELGMPPAAGEGIGIDRLVMLFTNSTSIREVILFPLMKPE